MERTDHTFPRRFWGIDPPDPHHTNYTDEGRFRRFLERLSLLELKELRKESASKMTDNELWMLDREIKNKENTALIAEQMLEEMEQPHATE